jgi:hypothetical protein
MTDDDNLHGIALDAVEECNRLRAEVESASIEIKRLRAEANKAEAERDEARAELARLTTLRPASEHDPNEHGNVRWFFHTDDYWAEVRCDHRRPQYATHWTPLPPVKEADK